MERIKKNTGKNGTDKRIYCGSNKASASMDIYMIALVIVGWNLPAVRKGLNKDTDSSNKQKENR